MYTVVLKKAAAKEFEQLDPRIQVRIDDVLHQLKTEPQLGKPLQGRLKGIRSIRVWPYRIMYTIEKKQLIVFVIKIAHRQGVYR